MVGRLARLGAVLAICAAHAAADEHREDREEEIRKLKSMLERLPETSSAHTGLKQKIKEYEEALRNPGPAVHDHKKDPIFYGKYVRVVHDVHMVRGMKGHIGYAFDFDEHRYEVEFAPGTTPTGGNLMLNHAYLELAEEKDAPKALVKMAEKRGELPGPGEKAKPKKGKGKRGKGKGRKKDPITGEHQGEM